MKRSKVITFLTILFCTSNSCKKSIEIPLPDIRAIPTMNAFMTQDSIIYAKVTLSARNRPAGYRGDEFLTPEHTLVKLYEDGNYIETLHDTSVLAATYFISNKRVEAGKMYHMTAEVPGYDMVEGQNIIPDRKDFSVSNKTSFLTTSKDGQDINFNFILTNESSFERRYRLRMWYALNSFHLDPNGDTVRVYSDYLSLSLPGGGISVIDDDYTDPYVGGVYSIQALKPGESKAINLKTGNYTSTDSLHLEISLLTEDLYQYLNSLNNVIKNNDDPTAEKQNVICNVKNGFGIIGGQAIKDVLFIRP